MPDAPVITLRPKGRLCGAKTKSGTKCRREAGWGTDHPGRKACKLHGGSTPAAKASAAMEGAREALVEFKARLPFYGNAPGVVPSHPFQVILDNVHRSNMAVLWLEGIIQGWGLQDSPAGDSPNPSISGEATPDRVLDEGGVSFEDGEIDDARPAHGRAWASSYPLPDSERTGLGVPLQTVSVYGKGGAVHDSEYLAFLRLYAEERVRAVQMAKVALDAGIDERMARLDEEQGRHMKTIIDAVLRRKGIEPSEDVAALILEEVVALDAKLTTGQTA